MLQGVNPRGPGYILQRQTLGGEGFPHPYKQRLPDCFGAVFFIQSLIEIYITEEPMQNIGSPAFIFWPGVRGTLEPSFLKPTYILYFHTGTLGYY